MRIAKSSFKKIIKEEYNRLLNEIGPVDTTFTRARPRGVESAYKGAAKSMNPWGVGKMPSWYQIEAAFRPITSRIGDFSEGFIQGVTKPIKAAFKQVDETGRDIYEWAGLPQWGLTDEEKYVKARANRVLNWYADLFEGGYGVPDYSGETLAPAEKIKGTTTRGAWDSEQELLAVDVAMHSLGLGLTAGQAHAARLAAKAIATSPRANLNSIVNAASSGAKSKGWSGPGKGVLFKRAQNMRKQKGLPARELPDVKPRQFEPPAGAAARKAKAEKALGKTQSWYERGYHAPRAGAFEVPVPAKRTLTTPDGSTVKLIGNTMIGGGHTYQIVELTDGRRVAFYRSRGKASRGASAGVSPKDQWNPVGAVGDFRAGRIKGQEPQWWLSKLPETHPEAALNLRTGARRGKVAAANSPMGQAAQALDGHFRVGNPDMRAQWAHVDDWSKLSKKDAYANIMGEFHQHGAYKPWHKQQAKAVRMEYQPAGRIRRGESRPRGWTDYSTFKPKFAKLPESYPWDIDPRIVTRHKQTMMIDNKPVTPAGNPIPTTHPIDLTGPKPGRAQKLPQMPSTRKVPETIKRKLPST